MTYQPVALDYLKAHDAAFPAEAPPTGRRDRCTVLKSSSLRFLPLAERDRFKHVALCILGRLTCSVRANPNPGSSPEASLTLALRAGPVRLEGSSEGFTPQSPGHGREKRCI